MILITASPFLTGPRWVSENSCSANELSYTDSDRDQHPQGALAKLMFQSWDMFLSCLVFLPLFLMLIPISIKIQFDSTSCGNWLACSETSTVLLAKHFNTSCLEGPFPKLSHFPAAVCQRQHLGKESLRIWFCTYRQQQDDPFKHPCVCPVICLSLTSKHKLRSIAQWDSENISLAYGGGTKAGRHYWPLCFALLLGAPQPSQLLLKSEMVQNVCC